MRPPSFNGVCQDNCRGMGAEPVPALMDLPMRSEGLRRGRQRSLNQLGKIRSPGRQHRAGDLGYVDAIVDPDRRRGEQNERGSAPRRDLLHVPVDVSPEASKTSST